MSIGYLSKREAEEKRHRWAEEVLGLLAQQRPVDAARLRREWDEITLAEQEAEESQRRWQESLIVVAQVILVPTVIAWIAVHIWGLSRYFFLIIPAWIVVMLIYFWLADKFKKKLNRRKKA